jgi:hypothetical protein
VAVSSALVADETPKTLGPQVIECHLDVKERSGSALDFFPGELTLKNTSPRSLKIEFVCDPLEWLDLDIKDGKGQTLPKKFHGYGELLAARSLRPHVFAIEPGAVYRRRDVGLFALVDWEKHPIKPGKYTVEAVYKCKTTDGMDVSAKSNPVMIEVTAK